MHTERPSPPGRPAVFLDRDGVLLEDAGILTDPAGIRILPGVPEALARLSRAGLALVVVTNQAAVARGLLTEEALGEIHARMAALLSSRGAPPLDGVYACPHHPEATLPAYRADCACRKPRPGLLIRAAADLGLDLGRSFLVGDRPSDIAAGRAAGCRTVLVETGRHGDPPIRSSEPFDPGVAADHRCPDLAAAADWIVARVEEGEGR
jgi:D-glycero-D-manno-heptose 1,7-bisphosphate phosphatase